MRTILISGASRGIGLNIAHKELKAVSYTHLRAHETR